MDNLQNSAVSKIIAEFKRLETELKNNASLLAAKSEELESKKSILNSLKDINQATFQKIAMLKKEISREDVSQKEYSVIKAEYDRCLQQKNELINKEKKVKSEISQKKIRIKKTQYESKQTEDAIEEHKKSGKNPQILINYEKEISRREKLSKEQDELKIDISFLKKSNKALSKEIDEMNYILKRLENSIK